jgi:hypothetical protein
MLPITDQYPASYNELVHTFPASILLDVSDDDYQGETRLLIRDENRFGYLRFGWGSCSGCDALQAADGSIAELTELRDQLAREVHWEDDAYSLAHWMAYRDWGLTEWPDPATHGFVVRSLEILAEHAARPVPQLPPPPELGG